jgi:hypothetical protein
MTCRWRGRRPDRTEAVADEEVQNAVPSPKRMNGSAYKVAAGGKARGSERFASCILAAKAAAGHNGFSARRSEGCGRPRRLTTEFQCCGLLARAQRYTPSKRSEFAACKMPLTRCRGPFMSVAGGWHYSRLATRGRLKLSSRKTKTMFALS